jgi:hypothetical protein
MRDLCVSTYIQTTFSWPPVLRIKLSTRQQSVKIYFIITLQSVPMSSRWSPSFRFSHQNSTFLFPWIIIHNPFMHLTFILLVITCRACLSLTTFNTSVVCGSWNSLCNSLSYSICHTSPSVMGRKTGLSTFLPNALNKPSPQFVKHQVSDTYKNNGLISVLHTSLTDQILSVSAIHNTYLW